VFSVLAVAFLSGCSGDSGEPADPRLQNPLLLAGRFNETAPEFFQARVETTSGVFLIEVHRDWAPLGADRFYNLVKRGWYDGVRFHRVLPEFTAGWGIHDDPYVNFVWQKELLVDDPVTQSNTRGRVSFARSGANSRTTQVFVNLKDNSSLDDRFAPFGEVVEGMEVVEGLYSEYGDGPPRGEGVYQAMALARGAEYFDAEFPYLDRIERVTIP
jgi:peptidyl-prolyl cis-trans isomerase A (cyclophilin A)